MTIVWNSFMAILGVSTVFSCMPSVVANICVDQTMTVFRLVQARRLLQLVLFLVHRFLSPWWRRRQVPPKRRLLQEPHCVTSQKTPFFIEKSILQTEACKRLHSLVVTVPSRKFSFNLYTCLCVLTAHHDRKHSYELQFEGDAWLVIPELHISYLHLKSPAGVWTVKHAL
jgi:hypothetical protein